MEDVVVLVVRSGGSAGAVCVEVMISTVLPQARTLKIFRRVQIKQIQRAYLDNRTLIMTRNECFKSQIRRRQNKMDMECMRARVHSIYTRP